MPPGLVLKPAQPGSTAGRSTDPTEVGLLRDLRRSRIRRRIWIAMAAAQAVYLIAIVFWPH
jgi:hypothetical protein